MKLALAIIILLLFPLMVSVNGNSLQPQSAGMRNIAIQIMVSPTTYDAFVSWITPFTANFHNFTIIVELDNGNYDWFLHNSTRVNFLTSIGEVIPDINADFHNPIYSSNTARLLELHDRPMDKLFNRFSTTRNIHVST